MGSRFVSFSAGVAFAMLGAAPLASVCEASPTERFVVGPDVATDNVDTFADLSTALTTAGLASGAVIEIEPGASAMELSSFALTNAQSAAPAGFTIRAHPSLDPAEHAPVFISAALTLTAPDVHLENVNLQLAGSGKLTANGSGFVLEHCRIFGAVTGNAVELNGASAVVKDNRFLGAVGAFSYAQLMVLAAATGSTIRDNYFESTYAAQLISYATSGAPKNDLIEGNTFRGPRGIVATPLVGLQAVSNVTIRDNDFSDADFASNALWIAYGAQSILIEQNRIELPVSTDAAIYVGSGSNVATSFSVAGNDVRMAPNGIGILLGTPSSGMAALVEGNRFQAGRGVFVVASSSVATIDLGAGAQGSLGGNDFRGCATPASSSAGAIVVSGPASTMSAAGNVFAGDAETAVFDFDDEATRPDVATGPPPSANAAYVASLYARFLRRAADPLDPAGAGAAVAQLDTGRKPSIVVRQIVRSEDALGFVVDRAYRSILLRGATPDERSAALAGLARKREEDLIASLLASPEARGRLGSDQAFVYEAFENLLGRLPTSDELDENAARASKGSKGRSKVVKTIQKSAEFSERRVTDAMHDLLGRDPTQDESKKLGKLDRLSLLTAIAASDEYRGI